MRQRSRRARHTACSCDARSAATKDATPGAVAFYDDAGHRCEWLMDAEPVRDATLVAMRVRCLDARGRVVTQVDPNLLVQAGAPATMSVENAGHTVGVSVVTTVDDAAAAPPAVRRSVPAQKGAQTYRFLRMAPPWSTRTCTSEDLQVEVGKDALLVTFEGRFRPGDVLRASCVADAPDGEIEVPIVVMMF